MSTILAVGIASVDIIQTLASYPVENSEQRALSQRICRGGNATNTLAILSQLGHQGVWAGVISDDDHSGVIRSDLESFAIDCRYAQQHQGGVSPLSCIVLGQQSGSRTIVHYRDIPEYPFSEFKRIPLREMEWVHFEGRNVEQTRLMLQYLKEQCPHIPVSIEIEKPREGIEELFAYADVLFFSRPFVEAAGYQQAEPFLQHMHERFQQAELFCSWGEAGAYAMNARVGLIYAPAVKQHNVVDTVGAGDTFNAAVIHAALSKQSLQDQLNFACALASRKCAHEGLRFELS